MRVDLRFTIICYTAPKPTQLRCKPALHKADYSVLRREAKNLDWDSIYGLYFQDAYSFIAKKISSLIDQFVPKVNSAKTKKNYMNWDTLLL